MDFQFMLETLERLLPGVPMTLELAFLSCAIGAFLALGLASMRLSSNRLLSWFAQIYVFVFRGTPLLVQLFLVYYGLSQFAVIRHSFLWPFLREPFWCAVLALSLNTGAYASEIVRGGLLSVPAGQVEAAKACGMSRALRFRRIILPLAIREALPAYSTELILMIKSTSLASIITLMEVTGLAAQIISETYRVIEVFVLAGALYLLMNFVLTRILLVVERWLSPDMRDRPLSFPTESAISGDLS